MPCEAKQPTDVNGLRTSVIIETHPVEGKEKLEILSSLRHNAAMESVGSISLSLGISGRGKVSGNGHRASTEPHRLPGSFHALAG